MSAYIKLKNPSQLDNIVRRFKKDYDDFLDNRDVIKALEQNNFDKLYKISGLIFSIDFHCATAAALIPKICANSLCFILLR